MLSGDCGEDTGDGKGSDCEHRGSGAWEHANEGEFGEARERSGGPSEPTDGDGEEGSDHFRIKMRACVADEFGAGGWHAHGFLVGAHGGHGLKRVGDADDASGEGDFVSGEPEGITGAVVLLVVLVDAVAPFAQP